MLDRRLQRRLGTRQHEPILDAIERDPLPAPAELPRVRHPVIVEIEQQPREKTGAILWGEPLYRLLDQSTVARLRQGTSSPDPARGLPLYDLGARSHGASRSASPRPRLRFGPGPNATRALALGLLSDAALLAGDNYLGRLTTTILAG
jgi:hypothetical protein